MQTLCNSKEKRTFAPGLFVKPQLIEIITEVSHLKN